MAEGLYDVIEEVREFFEESEVVRLQDLFEDFNVEQEVCVELSSEIPGGDCSMVVKRCRFTLRHKEYGMLLLEVKGLTIHVSNWLCEITAVYNPQYKIILEK